MPTEFKPYNPEEEKRVYRIQLPHWRQAGTTYFVTWRLAESLPQEKLKRLGDEKARWLQENRVGDIAKADEQTRHAFQKKFTAKIHQWLDAGYGECELKIPECAVIVADAMKFFDGKRYALDEFVVMPNHVHALLTPAPEHALERTLHSWKSYTSHQINKHLNREGTFWLSETWDHIVRSGEQLDRFRIYIRENPVKARLSNRIFILEKGKGILGG
jgi:REP element-mobilizing transposase RayT